MASFNYAKIPIDSTTSEIRLLDLHPTSPLNNPLPNSPLVHCTLRKAALHDTPSFHALSYVWGNEKDRGLISLQADGEQDATTVSVTANLQSALLHLQHPTDKLTLWVDAVCIDQSNVPEKNLQVQMMKDIYEGAARVVVWLGAEADGSGDAFRILRKLGEGRQAEDALAYRDAHRSMEQPPSGYVRFRTFCREEAARLPLGFNMQAIHKLTLRPWWQRIWVVQELALARDVVFVCGGESLAGRALQAASLVLSFVVMEFVEIGEPTREDYVTKSEKVYQYANIVTNIPDSAMGRMLGLRRRYQLETTTARETLLDLLFRTTVVHSSPDNFKATMARDRIYGLLGMAEDTGRLQIIPDYRKTTTTETVFTDVAYALLRNGFSEIFSLCQSPKKLEGLPSWVPDWTAQIRTPIGGRAPQLKYHAAGKTGLYMSSKADSKNTLSVKGVQVDTIYEVGTPWLPSLENYQFEWETLTAFLDDIKRLCAYSDHINSSIYTDPQQRQEAHWRVPTADQVIATDYDPNPVRSSKAGTELHSAYQEVLVYLSHWRKVGSVPDAVSRYMRVMGSLFDRRPFVTTQGFIGLGPSCAEPGDEVYIFMGAQVLFVMRRCGENAVKLLGEAYVHGIMDGELLNTDFVECCLQIV
ncbi:uncharacterized protein N0V89_006540 [Didymosphaeria variabile]|uniref:Heterokaryon incompatibility domain-containing protein n=1 Tax=Didymosphaeria variabile TaxID=1932322 RepID=A0A9W8XJ68_9PLEO|nr:uncharacterized protein N0V89_006540 [Didymosphaeria variabile]KAJ4351201.1 hypothetical protein N0V89_006540 [Didymosphaeria variabile]